MILYYYIITYHQQIIKKKQQFYLYIYARRNEIGYNIALKFRKMKKVHYSARIRG
jgi:hypothetical protein